MAKEKGLIPVTNNEVFGKSTVEAKVAKLAPCLKSDPIDWRYGLINGSPRDCAENSSQFESIVQ